jgi:5-methylcytosine-specific restriction endonuclease McrA
MREALKNDVPEEWRLRAKAGLCPVCAKTKDQWAKGARIFCGKKCRDDYASKYCYWSDVRQKILERDRNICQKCGNSGEKHRVLCDKIKSEKLKEWAEKNQDIIKTRRDEMMVRLDRRFQNEYNEIMDDIWIAGNTLTWEEKNALLDGVPQEPNMEVDHIVPIHWGGEMWHESNMQTLCKICHKQKTKEEAGK